MISSATHIVSAVGPGLASALSVNHNWKVAMQVPAIIAIGAAPVVMMTTWDKPSDVGYEDQLTLGGMC